LISDLGDRSHWWRARLGHTYPKPKDSNAAVGVGEREGEGKGEREGKVEGR